MHRAIAAYGAKPNASIDRNSLSSDVPIRKARAGTFGALLLGYYTDDGKLIYAGRVGTECLRRCLRICVGVLTL
jgi:hypothetical protein